jgi:hypothetical protein
VRDVVLSLSVLLEPACERLLPRRLAEHGVFVFRRT